MKSIIPLQAFSTWKWDKNKLDEYRAYSVLMDLEKALNYLDGQMTAEVDLHKALSAAQASENFRNIECKHFFVTLYKKGTVHIKFKHQELIDRLNIFVARNRAWLPPDYGYTPYSDMGAEEKEVIDDFQGEAAYNAVVANKGKYLFEIKNNSPLLLSGT